MTDIRYTPLQVFRAEAYCDCGGQMQRTHITLTCAPPLYPHVCSDCGKKENLRQVYPSITYKEIEP